MLNDETFLGLIKHYQHCVNFRQNRTYATNQYSAQHKGFTCIIDAYLTTKVSETMIIYEVLRPRCKTVDVVYHVEIELIAECTIISVQSLKFYAEKELSISPETLSIVSKRGIPSIVKDAYECNFIYSSSKWVTSTSSSHSPRNSSGHCPKRPSPTKSSYNNCATATSVNVPSQHTFKTPSIRMLEGLAGPSP